ncbi:ATP synthase subunit d, mitochondrial [Copidosoma floridanum]|uniref:ATP synthase subunit d, mitochondrial n=1 Tax=Copidosoma floridanum TaxID=29053 RepID=UPI0006C94F75|nr:ATP synthase subunit d, mitochondrial [Copidosoma floridanum]
MAASRRAIKAINWAALTERIHESERNTLTAFKAKSDLYLRQLQANPENPPKIDWSFYKKKIATPALVDKFQKEYESLSIPYPQDKYSSLIDEQEKLGQEHVKKFISESNERIEKFKKELEHLGSLLKYGEMTMEDFAEAHPDLALDPINRPTIFPHTPDVQPDAEDSKEKSH